MKRKDPETLMLADLARSGLGKKDARRLGVESLTPDETQRLIAGNASGWKSKGAEYAVPSYRIPYRDLNGKETKFYRLRLLEEVTGYDGKYWQPPNSGCRFYLPPGVDWKRIARDAKQVIYFTEGEKKAAALCKLGVWCIGLGGVASWRTHRRPIDDFGLFDWRNRRVGIVFDSDILHKYDVQRELNELAGELIRRGALPGNVSLPGKPGDPKIGVDDFIVARGGGAKARRAFEALPFTSLLLGESHTTQEIIATEFPEPRWAIEGLLPEGATLLAGPPKIGKSWLVLHLTLAVLTGGKALGVYKAKAGDVLYLGLEDTARRLQDRLKRLLNGARPPSRGTFATAWRKPEDHGLTAIERWLDDHPDARLIVVDTLQRMRRARRKDGVLYEDDYEAMRDLKEIADRRRVAIIIVHHTRKAASDDPFELISGSTGLTGGCDTMIVLQRARMADEAVLQITGRDIDERSLALEFNASTMLWRSLGDAREHFMSEERKQIVDAMKALGGAASPTQVAEALGKSPSTIKTTMARMNVSGQLRRAEKGRYELPEGSTPGG